MPMGSRRSAPEGLVDEKRFGLERIVGVRKQVELRGLVVKPFGIRKLGEHPRPGFNEPKPRWSSRPLTKDRLGAQDPESADRSAVRQNMGVREPLG